MSGTSDRPRLEKYQVERLAEVYKKNKQISSIDCGALSKQLGMSSQRVKSWFYNKRRIDQVRLNTAKAGLANGKKRLMSNVQDEALVSESSTSKGLSGECSKLPTTNEKHEDRGNEVRVQSKDNPMKSGDLKVQKQLNRISLKRKKPLKRRSLQRSANVLNDTTNLSDVSIARHGIEASQDDDSGENLKNIGKAGKCHVLMKSVDGETTGLSQLSDNQIEEMEKVFQDNPYIPSNDYAVLSSRLGISPQSVMIWFKNKRQAMKVKDKIVKDPKNIYQTNTEDAPKSIFSISGTKPKTMLFHRFNKTKNKIENTNEGGKSVQLEIKPLTKKSNLKASCNVNKGNDTSPIKSSSNIVVDNRFKDENDAGTTRGNRRKRPKRPLDNRLLSKSELIQRQRQKTTRFSQQQLEVMESRFNISPYISASDYRALAERLQADHNSVRNWFANTRRIRYTRAKLGKPLFKRKKYSKYLETKPTVSSNGSPEDVIVTSTSKCLRNYESVINVKGTIEKCESLSIASSLQISKQVSNLDQKIMQGKSKDIGTNSEDISLKSANKTCEATDLFTKVEDGKQYPVYDRPIRRKLSYLETQQMEKAFNLNPNMSSVECDALADNLKLAHTTVRHWFETKINLMKISAKVKKGFIGCAKYTTTNSSSGDKSNVQGKTTGSINKNNQNEIDNIAPNRLSTFDSQSCTTSSLLNESTSSSTGKKSSANIASQHVNDSGNKRQRFTFHQLSEMQKAFHKDPYLSSRECAKLAKRLGVHPHRIQVWYNNTRRLSKNREQSRKILKRSRNVEESLLKGVVPTVTCKDTDTTCANLTKDSVHEQSSEFKEIIPTENTKAQNIPKVEEEYTKQLRMVVIPLDIITEVSPLPSLKSNTDFSNTKTLNTVVNLDDSEDYVSPDENINGEESSLCSDIPGGSNNSSSSLYSDRFVGEIKRFTCVICEEMFGSENLLERHKMTCNVLESQTTVQVVELQETEVDESMTSESPPQPCPEASHPRASISPAPEECFMLTSAPPNVPPSSVTPAVRGLRAVVAPPECIDPAQTTPQPVALLWQRPAEGSY